VLPTGMLRRTSRLVALPMRHAARTAATASRLSRATAEEVATRGVEQAFATLGELRGGAVKLGQAFSLFEAAMPAEVAGPYRSAVNRLSEATPGMPAAVVWRVVTGDLSLAYGSSWRDRLVDFDDAPAAAASIGQVHRGRWRDDSGDLVDVAVKVQYPGVAKALRSDVRTARILGRLVGRLTGLDLGWFTDELAARMLDEVDYPREARVQRQVAAAFARRMPGPSRRCPAAGVREPPGRTRVVVPHVYAATPRVLVSRWLDGVPLTALLDGGTDQLPVGWQGLERAEAADLAGRLIGHAGYAPASCTGWMHADPHPATSCCCRAGGLAWWTSARSPRCLTAFRNRSAGSPRRYWPQMRRRLGGGLDEPACWRQPRGWSSSISSVRWSPPPPRRPLPIRRSGGARC
jgi:predicted unusual protein kinase regulating ubiquinone biosynthesis (AarF/ABC1/UbiB family)